MGVVLIQRFVELIIHFVEYAFFEVFVGLGQLVDLLIAEHFSNGFTIGSHRCSISRRGLPLGNG